MGTKYVKKRDQLKRANLKLGVFLPLWFITWVSLFLFSEQFPDNHIINTIFKSLAILVIISLIPMLVYTWNQLSPYYGPWAKCEACGADAIVWNVGGDKLTDLTRKYFDKCPNCGNDNTVTQL